MPSSSRKTTSASRKTRLSGTAGFIALILIMAFYLYQDYQAQNNPSNSSAPVVTETVLSGSSRETTPVSNGQNLALSSDIAVWFSDPWLNLKTGGPEEQLDLSLRSGAENH